MNTIYLIFILLAILVLCATASAYFIKNEVEIVKKDVAFIKYVVDDETTIFTEIINKTMTGISDIIKMVGDLVGNINSTVQNALTPIQDLKNLKVPDVGSAVGSLGSSALGSVTSPITGTTSPITPTNSASNSASSIVSGISVPRI